MRFPCAKSLVSGSMMSPEDAALVPPQRREEPLVVRPRCRGVQSLAVGRLRRHPPLHHLHALIQVLCRPTPHHHHPGHQRSHSQSPCHEEAVLNKLEVGLVMVDRGAMLALSRLEMGLVCPDYSHHQALADLVERHGAQQHQDQYCPHRQPKARPPLRAPQMDHLNYQE